MADIGGVALHWREEGEGVPLVLANSLGTDLRLWDDVLAHLSAGRRVIRFDLRGHGLSDCPPGPYDMDALVAEVAAFLDHLAAGPCVFAGVSLGGMIGQGLAAARPDLVRALVISNSAARMGSADLWEARIARARAGGLQAIADEVLDRWFAPGAAVDRRLWRNMLTRTPLEGYVGCCAAIAGADLTAAAGRIAVPVLAIAAAEDRASSPDQVRETAALIRDARVEVIAGAGHLPCVEAPARFAALIDAFTREHCDD